MTLRQRDSPSSHAQHQHLVTQRPRRSPRTGGQRIECDRCDGFPNGLEECRGASTALHFRPKKDSAWPLCPIYRSVFSDRYEHSTVIKMMISYDQLPGLGDISAAITAPSGSANQLEATVSTPEKRAGICPPSFVVE
ncbi:hypothetical protein TgHK011_001455 [Trichoderma gracile]|nr:hypothetical protein TgHK011_001455 [Trichoderma gracile]